MPVSRQKRSHKSKNNPVPRQNSRRVMLVVSSLAGVTAVALLVSAKQFAHASTPLPVQNESELARIVHMAKSQQKTGTIIHLPPSGDSCLLSAHNNESGTVTRPRLVSCREIENNLKALTQKKSADSKH